eukprot:SAG22_NODE_5073_length_1092_cov_1.043303_1_plen_153_part_10
MVGCGDTLLTRKYRPSDPGGASDEMGPTAIIPRSHILTIDGEDWGPIAADGPASLSPGLAERRLTSPARQAKAVLIHYDMLHRGCCRTEEESESHPWRPMYKFQFTRVSEPVAASWDLGGGGAEPPAWPDSPLAPAWQATFDWMQGRGGGSDA